LTKKELQLESESGEKLDSDGIQLATKLLELVTRRVEQHEAQSEQRVRLFLTLGSGSIAILTILSRFGALPDPISYWTTIIVLLILLIFGFETVHSLNWQQIYVRSNSKLDSSLRATLANQYQFAAKYSAIIEDAERLRDQPTWWRRRIRGSLPEFMYIANGLIASGIIMTILWGIGAFITFIVCMVTTLLFIFAQYIYSKWMRNIIPETWVKDSSVPLCY
jgi:hypothetical protein